MMGMARRQMLTVALVLLAIAGIVLTSVGFATDANPEPTDFSLFGPAGELLLRGQWAEVFSDPTVQAGPFELAFWGIPHLLAVSGSVGWAVFFIVASSVGAVVVAIVVRRPLAELDSDWWVPLAAGLVALLSVVGTLTKSVAEGHPAQLAIPVLWVLAARLSRGGAPVAAAAVLACSAGWELWGLLGVPVLMLAPRLSVRLAATSLAAVFTVVVAIYLPFVLVGPFPMFGFSWPISEGSLTHLLWPDATAFSWPLRLAQGVIVLVAAAAVARATYRSVDGIWLTPLAVCAVRLLTDPVLASYYSIAPEVLICVGIAFAAARRTLAALLLGLVMLNLAIDVRPITVLTTALLVATVAVAVVLVRRETQKKSGLGVEA